MTYEQFIDELMEFIATGELLRGRATAGTPELRAWRHRVESVVREIQAEGYIIPGSFNLYPRAFRATWDFAKAEDHRVAFERDIVDTLNELRYMVQHFEKYGPGRLQGQRANAPTATPTPASAVSIPVTLPTPERVTIRWLIDNVPVKLWLLALGIAGAAFLVGFGVAQTPAGRDAVCWIKPDACPQPTVPAKR